MYQGVQNGFKAAPRVGVVKGKVAHGGAVQRVISRYDGVAKLVANSVHGAAVWRSEFVCDEVRINDAGPPFLQHVGHLAFARPDTPSKPDFQHGCHGWSKTMTVPQEPPGIHPRNPEQ